MTYLNYLVIEFYLIFRVWINVFWNGLISIQKKKQYNFITKYNYFSRVVYEIKEARF